MPYDTRNGQLPYPLNYLPSDGGEVISPFVMGNPDVPSDSTNWYVVCLTPQEMVNLQSVVAIGSPILFPDNFNDMIQKYAQVREFPNIIPEDSCMDLCDLIVQCINDPNSDVFQTILDRLSELDELNSRTVGQNQSDLIFGGDQNPLCDLDVLWGGIQNVVSRANSNNIDALQFLELLSNPSEWVAEVVGGVFGVELPILQSMLDWANWIQDNVLENYEALMTVAYLEEIQCDLFCLSKDTCELTPEMLTDYFFERLSSVLSFSSLLNDSLQFIFAGSWSGTELLDVMFLSQFAFRSQFGKWFEYIAFGSLELDFRLGMNDANNDWILLCTECPEQWSFESDFTIDEQGWLAILAVPNNTPRADYITDTGWTTNGYNQNGVNTRSEVRIWTGNESRDANNIILEIDSSVLRTIGIFVWTCDAVGTVIESLYSQEGINLANGLNNFDVDLTVPTIAHAGYRVDFRSTNGEIRMTAFATKYTLSGEV